MKRLCPLLALAACLAAQAQATDRPDLPDTAMALAVIDADPAVARARFALEAARHRGTAIAAGPYEWTISTSAQRRRYRTGEPDAREWSAGLERTFRAPGKAGLDSRLGDAQVRVASAQFALARLEVAQSLLEMWMDWAGAERLRAAWAAQQDFAQANADAVGRRQKAGDASRLDENNAAADLVEVQRQRADADSLGAIARARLQARFPQLRLAAPPLRDPLPLDGEAGSLRSAILDGNAALAVLQEQSREAALAASRAEADRTPDPTLGVNTVSEGRAGAERLIGLTLSIPLGGTYRDARVQEALRMQDAAQSALDARWLELEALVAERLADAGGSYARWQYASRSMAITRDNARLTQRAFSLGEADLQTLLLSRRLSGDAALGELQARSAALRAGYRLRLEAHQLWALEP
ncbi:TolC family protein [Xylophilus rhododendri]|uniref:TolC family protein n=1 Tax=Xylophilus rhododendri TaxID=2697032 RepID=A0A857J8X7_9BURK|nr:TolC family protein [Xylophilus rhododendri]QHJ00435.1 TolC family protein [Xylophilus rhododendri]